MPTSLPISTRAATAGDLPVAGHRAASLYVHVPFCVHKCHYCDFYSIVDSQDRRAAFVTRLLDELAASAAFLDGPLATVFVGGGTPTMLEPEQFQRILDALAAGPGLRADCEFTVEANPETVTPQLAGTLAGGGVNRMSFGAQSFDPRHLHTLERRHDPASVGRAVRLARAAGIGNVSLDLIFGIPGQTLDEWRADLQRALALEPDHLSCYGLMYEPNTPLAVKLRAGAIRRVDEAVEASMYELVIDLLAAAGFEQYEISSWARPGRACRHNEVYWANGAWWPIGPSAAGHAGGVRWRNVPRLGDYLASSGLPPCCDVERLDEDGRVGETLMLGLRRLRGIPSDRLEELLATGSRGGDRARAIDRFVADSLLERAGPAVRLTRRGLLLADTVLADLL